MRDPERHATWLAALPEHGPRAELVLVGEDGGGRQVTLRVTDRRGTAEYVSPTEEQPGTGQAVASFPIPRPRPGEVVVEATIAADRVANAFLCTTRGARFQETVAWRRS